MRQMAALGTGVEGSNVPDRCLQNQRVAPDPDDAVVIDTDRGMALMLRGDDLFLFQNHEVVGSFRGLRDGGSYSNIAYTGVSESGDRMIVQDSNGDGELDIRWIYQPGEWRSTTQVRGNNAWYTFKCEERKCGFLVDGELKSADEVDLVYPSAR